MAFSFWKALGHGFTQVRERPMDALRIWVFDALLLALLLASFHVLASVGGDGRLTVSLSGLPVTLTISSVLIILAGLVGLLCSEGAWARFLATDQAVGAIPYKLGKDELRIFGTSTALGILVMVILVIASLPFLVIGVGLRSGDVSVPAAAQLLPFAVLIILAFAAVRIGAASILAVRRQAFSPFDHFSATSPFWFRLGLAFISAAALTFVLTYVVPGVVAGMSGLQPPTQWRLGFGIPNPWLEWLLDQKVIGPAHIPVVLLATVSSGFAALVARGIYAHAAIHALEQDALDARNAYPASAT